MFVRGKLHSGLDWVRPLGLAKAVPYYSTASGAAYHRNAIELLRLLPSDSVDLVMTSPPFALTRQKEYGNEPVDRYLEWFLPFCREIQRIIKPTGSFVLDIGGAWTPGAPVRSTYHFEVAVSLVRDGFRLAQDFYWYNPSRLPSPAEWVTVRRVRVKDAVNMVWWFSKTNDPKADNRKVLAPHSEGAGASQQNGGTSEGHDDERGAHPKDYARVCESIPSNLLTIPESDCSYLRACRARDIQPQPARYPEALVHFFLKLLTDEGDLVVDPFCGSNATGSACESLGRRWLAFDIKGEYLANSVFRFDPDPPNNPPRTHGDPTPI